MSFASRRETTRPEDIAYCLLGIFNVNLPLLYGEGQTKAFFRLQEATAKFSNDLSILTWTRPPEQDCLRSSDFGAFARSPVDFRDGHSILRFNADVKSFRITNKGLKLSLPVIPDPGSYDRVLAVLHNCRFEDNYLSPVCISLRSNDLSKNIFIRHWGEVAAIDPNAHARSTVQTIYILIPTDELVSHFVDRKFEICTNIRQTPQDKRAIKISRHISLRVPPAIDWKAGRLKIQYIYGTQFNTYALLCFKSRRHNVEIPILKIVLWVTGILQFIVGIVKPSAQPSRSRSNLKKSAIIRVNGHLLRLTVDSPLEARYVMGEYVLDVNLKLSSKPTYVVPSSPELDPLQSPITGMSIMKFPMT